MQKPLVRRIANVPALEYETLRAKWPESGPAACRLLYTLAAATLFIGGIGWVYAYFIEFPPFILFLLVVPLIGGFIYAACARRIAHRQRAAAHVALALASLHAGALLIGLFQTTCETLQEAWWYAHPPRVGLVLDTPPNWTEYWVSTILSVGLTTILGMAIFHLIRYLQGVPSAASGNPEIEKTI